MQIYPRFAFAAPRRARVEIIPLIDVVFFLLATFVLFVFMLSSTRALPVPLPYGGKGGPESVTIQVTEDGAYWNQEKIAVSELPARLAAYRNSSAEPRVLLAGDRAVRWGPLVAVLDEVRKAGISRFSIETRTRPAGG